jgi:predicted esterase
MARLAWVPATWRFLMFALIASAPTAAAEGPFDGEWRTSIGTVTLKQTGNAVTGTYGASGQFPIKGTVQGKKLTFEYEEGQSRGEGNWTLDDTGHAFRGGYKVRGGQSGRWDGWRPDPDALKAKPVNVAGLWLTDLGLMELEQTGDKVTGRFALRGGSDIEGTVTGRRLEFTYKSFRPGNGWFDVAPSGTSFAGAAGTEGVTAWFGWRGRKAPEFARHAKVLPGKIVDGSTKNLLTYSVRAPDAYKDGDARKWPAVVILHGSNMNAKAYVNTIAAAWPDIAKDYLLIGINGERPSDLGGAGKEPSFNYTYVSYVGRSTFKGFPGTDRESPTLVAEALADLRENYPISKYFVGGHSQGGFLTYSLLMNTPELIAGAFPISAGVIFQCEPTAYADEKLRAAQRAVPLAIVHGKQDGVVNFSMGEYAATLFGEANWPALRFFADNTGAAHMFARLPVNQAIRWLEAHASDDPAKLVDFAEQRRKANAYRDAVAALNRAARLKLDPATQQRLDRLSRDIDAKAAAGAKQFLPQIQATGKPAKPWIDAFLAYRDDFEFAPAARETMQAFAALRAEHDGPAKKAFDEAHAAFQQNRRDDGYAKYQEIIDKYPAATSYRNVKRWLAERK